MKPWHRRAHLDGSGGADGVNLALAIPGPPGNIGTLELGATVALVGFGVAKEKALALGLVYHLLQLVPIGLLAMLFVGRAGRSEIRLTARPGADSVSAPPMVTRAAFGRLPDGRPVDVFTLTNGHGLEMRAISYGAIIVSLHAPDRSGRLEDVVLGHDDLAGYLGASPYFGAVVGRYANRIARGHLPLDGRVHELAINDPPHHLHGGRRGFDKVVWDVEETAARAAPG